MPCTSQFLGSPMLRSRPRPQAFLNASSSDSRNKEKGKMSKRERKIGHLAGLALLALVSGGFLVGMLTLRSTPVYAHIVPSPCDFTTGGGWILIPSGTASGSAALPESGAKANFGLVGGCKNGGFFGHVNYVDHNNGLHVSSTQILGYFCVQQVGTTRGSDGSLSPVCAPNSRDICGTARTDQIGGVFFRVRTVDAEQQSSPPPKDKFGIKLMGMNSDGTPNGDVRYLVPTRCLANGLSACNAVPGGGDIELHKANPSTTGPSPPPNEVTACGGSGDDLGFSP